MAEMDACVCKADSLRSLHAECRALCEELSDKGVEWTVRHIYREYDKVADALANDAFDSPADNGPSPEWRGEVAAGEARAESDGTDVQKGCFGGIPAHPMEEEVTEILRQWEREPRAVRQKLIRELYIYARTRTKVAKQARFGESTNGKQHTWRRQGGGREDLVRSRED